MYTQSNHKFYFTQYKIYYLGLPFLKYNFSYKDILTHSLQSTFGCGFWKLVLDRILFKTSPHQQEGELVLLSLK